MIHKTLHHQITAVQTKSWTLSIRPGMLPQRELLILWPMARAGVRLHPLLCTIQNLKHKGTDVH